MLVKRIWTENHADPALEYPIDVDVMVEMENGELWTAHFVTILYLQQQMELSEAMAEAQTGLGRVAFVALETPHVIVNRISSEAIEDIVDNLMVLGTFEAVFDLVIDTPEGAEQNAVEEQ
ncbi:MAG: hypothetical protein ACLFTK_06705 [Anaerolineales bacterium]